MRALPVLAACSLLALPACIAAVAAAGAGVFGVISHHNNESVMDVTQDLPAVFAAARQALKKLAFPVDDTQVAGATEGTLKAGDARVVVERQPGNFTRVRASVGTFDTDDNERRRKVILEEIQRLL